MLKRDPEFHDAPKLEDELATGVSGLGKDNRPSLSLFSDSRVFKAAWDPCADLISPLDELAFSQFTMSVNFSCNRITTIETPPVYEEPDIKSYSCSYSYKSLNQLALF